MQNVVVVTPNEKGAFTRIQADRWVASSKVKSAVNSARRTASALVAQGVPAKVLVDGQEV